MPKFEVRIVPIDAVENYPKKDRLSINRIRGYTLASNKLPDGSHRYKPGDLVAHVPVGATVPVALLKKRGYWDDDKDRGFLGGPRGQNVDAITFGNGVVSEGLIFPTTKMDGQLYIENAHGDTRRVVGDENVVNFLAISQTQRAYARSHVSLDHPIYESLKMEPAKQREPYEIEDIKKYPDLLKDKNVILTEMLHGILCVVGFDRTLGDDPYFVADSDGFAIYNFKKDIVSIYTRTAIPIWKEIERYVKEMPAVEKCYIFGEIIGPGIQDLTYGLENTEFRGIDIKIGVMGAGPDTIPFGFLEPIKKAVLFQWLNIATVPIISGGAFDMATIIEASKEPSVLGGGLRKGVVINAEDESLIDGKRPVLRLLADKFILRKNGTNYK